MSSIDVGQQFIRTYQNDGFQVLPRGSLLDPSVPMTFVGSAGLTQIETAIEQGEDRSGERYVLLQPCFRHFDLHRVGRSPVHLSLFEMGGSFAFGPGNREDVLVKAWHFLTGDLSYDPQRIWATYFSGGEVDGHRFEADDATRRIWQRAGVPPDQIVGRGIDVNFWKQGGGLSGQTRFRKCGPTTELFADRGAEHRCGPECQPGCDCDRFVEISNILFIHSRIDQRTGSLSPLTTPFAETVIGVERVTMSLGGFDSVFETEKLAQLTKIVRAYSVEGKAPNPTKRTRSERVIADHVRALVFLTADGAPRPGKGGRARIMRLLVRGVLAHQRILGVEGNDFIAHLADRVTQFNRQSYPGLARGREDLIAGFEIEGRRFERTLSAGYRVLDRFIDQGRERAITGEQAVDLVKHHGFPFPLLEATLAWRGVLLDKQDYQNAYARWRQAVLRTQ